MTKTAIEWKYGVTIDFDYWNNEYVIYSADGCKWENGLRTIKACERECKEWAKQLLEIKKNTEMRRAL